MTGLGTMVNCAAIVAGCAVGLILKKGFPEKWQETIMYGVALSIFLIGVEMAQKSQNVVLVIASVVIGSVIGEMLDLDGKLNRFGAWAERKLLGDRQQVAGTFGRAFVSASLLFCSLLLFPNKLSHTLPADILIFLLCSFSFTSVLLYHLLFFISISMLR